METQHKKRAFIFRGPIRLEVIVPVFIFVGLFSFYMSFFFDNHLKRAIEWTATQVNGAEVNIDDLSTSFLKGNLTISNIQVTDRDMPEQNTVQLGAIFFDLDMNALLQAKFVISAGELLDIGFFTPRKRPGRVLPPSEADSFFHRVQNTIMSHIQEEYAGTPIADLGAILDGADFREQIGDISSLIQSRERLQELKNDTFKIQSFWTSELEKIEDDSPIESLSRQINQFSFNSSRPQDSLTEIRQLYEETKATVSRFRNLQSKLGNDLNQVQSRPGEISRIIEKDYEQVSSRLRIPSFNVDALSSGLFSEFFGEIVSEVASYTEMIEQYMPPDKKIDEEDKEKGTRPTINPPERSLGETFHFPRQGGYPLFWLRRAVISSSADNQAWSGAFEGRVENLTNSPELINLPGVISLRGDLEDMEILGFDFNFTINHHVMPFNQELIMFVDSFPSFGSFDISSSERLKFSIEPESNQLKLRARRVLNEQTFRAYYDIEYFHNFLSPKFSIQTDQSSMERILTSSVDRLDKVDLRASARGRLSNLRLGISSNLSNAIYEGFKDEVEQKIQMARQEIRERINAELDPIVSDVNSYINKFNENREKLNTLLIRADELESLAKSKVDEASRPVQDVQDRLRQEGGEALDSLRRRLGR